jgi:uncharacterized protein (DUF58 family)
VIKRFWTELPLSREGMFWFFISLAMLLTGLLKGINLITLLSCWLVLLVLVNYAWACGQIRFIEAKRLFLEPAFAQTPFALHLQIVNSGKKNACGVTVRDGGPAHQVSRFLVKLTPAATARVRMTLQIERRGLYRLQPLELTSGYPLALVHVVKRMISPDELVIFPKLGQLQTASLRRFLARHSPTLGQARAFPRRHPGAQTEFHGLRPFHAGDSPRWIHWRTSARRGELMVREFEDMPNDHLILIVDPGLPGEPALERLLGLAATICWEWCRHKGDRLALCVAGPHPTVLVGNTSHDWAFALLGHLALVEPGRPVDALDLGATLRAGNLPPGPILLLSAGKRDLTAALHQALHRSVARIDVSQGEDKPLFDWDAPA